MADMKVRVVLQLLKEQFEGAINSAKSALGGFKSQTDVSGNALGQLGEKQDAAAASSANLGDAVKTMVVRYLSFVAVLEGARRLIGFADNLQLVAGRVKLASDGAVDFAKNYAALVAISFNSGTALEANATLFSRLNDTIKDLGGTSGDTLRFVDLLTKSLRISGAATEETNSVVRQLSQSLQSGRLNGDEFNAVMENGKTVGDALSESLGVNRGELRKLAEEGKLTSEIVISALIKQGDVIDRKYKEIPTTIGVAWTKITVAIGDYIKKGDEAIGVTNNIAKAFEGLAEKLKSGSFEAAFNGLSLRFLKLKYQADLAITLNPAKIDILEQQLKEIDALIVEAEAPAIPPNESPKPSGAFDTIPEIAESGSGKAASQLAKATLDAELEGIKRKQEAAKAAFDETVALSELAFKQQELNINKLGLGEAETAQRILDIKQQLEDDKLKAEVEFHKRSYDLEVAAIDAKAKAIAGATNLGLSGGNAKIEAQLAAAAQKHGFDLAAVQAKFAQAGQEFGIDPTVLKVQAAQESGFDPKVGSNKGALGFSQFMPDTAKDYGLKDRTDPLASIEAQAHLMRDLLKRYNGKLELALAAYNAGPGAVEGTGENKHEPRIPNFKETKNYVKKITGNIGNGDADNQAQTQELNAINEQKLAAKAAFNAKMRLLGVEETATVTAQSAEQLNIDRAALAERNAIEQQKLDGIRKAALDALELKQLQAQQDLDLGNIGQSEFLAKQQAFADERLEIERKYFEDKRALLGKDSLALLQNIQDQEQIIRDAEKRKKEIIDQAAKNQQTVFEGMVGPFKSAMSGMTNGILSGQQTITNAVRNAAANILSSYAATFLQERVMQAAQWAWKLTGLSSSLAAEQALKDGDLIYALYLYAADALGFGAAETGKATAKVTGEGVQTAAHVTGETTRKGVSLATSLAIIFAKAKEAAASTFASVSLIPVVGPFLAPIAAAAAFAGVMAFGAFSSKRGEMRVAKDGSPYILHENETVLPSPVADNFRKVVEIVQSYVGGEPTGVTTPGSSRKSVQPAGITAFNNLLSQNLIPKALSLPSFASQIPAQSQAKATSIARERLKAESSGLVPGAGGSKGDTYNYNINAMDSQTFGAFVSKAANRKHMATAMQAEARNFNRGKK